MNLTKMRDVVAKLMEGDEPRARNRNAINSLFDGEAPFTDQEAIDNHFYTNVQPLMAPRIAQQARQQLYRATMRGRFFFSVDIDLKDPDKALYASAEVTRLINRPIKKKREYRHLCRGIDASLFLHGRGPAIWDDTNRWCPRTLAMEDLKVPSGTFTDFSNLSTFAVYQRMSAAELWKKIKGPNVAKGWDVERVKMLIDKLATDSVTSNRDYNDTYFPESLALDLKENTAYYGSDKVPTAKCWWFYELDGESSDGEPHWKRYLFSDDPEPRLERIGMKDNFLFKDESGKLTDLNSILQVQFADGCNVPPFRYHTVRGPGYLLYPVLQLYNRLFCRQNDAIFEACNQMFKNVGEADRERLLQVTLANMSVLPTGVEVVPAQERYSVNHNLVKFGMDVLRQLIAENASTFVPDTNDGTQKEMTATQVMARVQEAAQLVQGIVATKSEFQQDQYEEMARRFTIKESRDPDVKKFQEAVKKLKLGDEVLDFERWEVKGETALGGGNKVLELASATELMKARPAFPPKSQAVILRKWSAAVLDDADEAFKLVPPEPETATKTAMFANLAIGTLLQSLPVALDSWVNLDEYVVTLVGLLATKVGGLAQNGSQPSQETLSGIMFTAQHIEDIVQAIAQDEAKAQFAKAVMQQLEQILQPVEQWMAAAQSDPMAGVPPEAKAKIMTMQLEAQTKSQIAQASAAQKRQNLEERSQLKFAADRMKLDQSLRAKDLQEAQKLAHQSAEHRQSVTQEAINAELERRQMAADAKAKGTEE